MELDGHQAAWFVANRAGPVALSAIGYGAALILTERKLARALLDARAVHAFYPPTAGQHDDPLRRRVFMPVANPADGLDGEATVASPRSILSFHCGSAGPTDLSS